jgi:uncharacterized membrane protein YkvA (DUF1232 family)
VWWCTPPTSTTCTRAAPPDRSRVPRLQRLREWADALKREVVALWFAYRDRRTPLLPKLLAMLIVAYALSPVDLIPDFIPVLGFLDELILLPSAIYLTLKLVPAEVLHDARDNAAKWLSGNNPKPRNWIVAGLIVLLWCGLLWLGWRAVAPLVRV